jgi:hypothetical protein
MPVNEKDLVEGSAVFVDSEKYRGKYRFISRSNDGITFMDVSNKRIKIVPGDEEFWNNAELEIYKPTSSEDHNPYYRYRGGRKTKTKLRKSKKSRKNKRRKSRKA